MGIQIDSFKERGFIGADCTEKPGVNMERCLRTSEICIGDDSFGLIKNFMIIRPTIGLSQVVIESSKAGYTLDLMFGLRVQYGGLDNPCQILMVSFGLRLGYMYSNWRGT